MRWREGVEFSWGGRESHPLAFSAFLRAVGLPRKASSVYQPGLILSPSPVANYYESSLVSCFFFGFAVSLSLSLALFPRNLGFGKNKQQKTHTHARRKTKYIPHMFALESESTERLFIAQAPACKNRQTHRDPSRCAPCRKGCPHEVGIKNGLKFGNSLACAFSCGCFVPLFWGHRMLLTVSW